MPRPKKKKNVPIDTGIFELDGEEMIAEVWNNPADAGTRGTHMQRKRYVVLEAVLNHCQSALTGQSTISKNKINRLIHGQDSLAEFGRIIFTIARTNNIIISQTLSEEIGQRVRIHYKAIEFALADQTSKK